MAHIEINLMSYTLKRNVEFTLILPSMPFGKDFEEKNNHYYRENRNNKYPLLILLHGYLNDRNAWTRFARAELFAEENDIAVVMISAENKWYVNSSKNDLFDDFIENELRDYLYGTFPISEKRCDNYIAGLSMGGFGALYHGLKYPDRYQEIGAFSPAPFMESEDLSLVGNELKELALLNKENLPVVHFSIGTSDWLLDKNRELKAFFDDNGINCDYEEVDGYSHEWRFWDMELEKFLKKIKRTDGHYKKTNRNV